MRALIIAAGEGSRLQQEGANTLKPLVKINGMTMIERLIRILEKLKFTEISIITNEKSYMIKEYLTNLFFNIDIKYLIKDTPSSFHSLYELYKTTNKEPFYLFTVDTIFRIDELIDYIDFINYCENEKSIDGVIGITSYIDDEKPLFVKLNGNLIQNFYDSKENCKYITGGLYYFSNDISNDLEIAINSDIFRLRNFLRLLINNNKRLGSFTFSKIIDVDHISDIVKAEQLVLNEEFI